MSGWYYSTVMLIIESGWTEVYQSCLTTPYNLLFSFLSKQQAELINISINIYGNIKAPDKNTLLERLHNNV